MPTDPKPAQRPDERRPAQGRPAGRPDGGRRSIRLPGHCYADPGAYFITICTHHRHRLFGRIEDGRMILSTFGEIVKREWLRSAEIRDNVQIEEFAIMPDHFHGILVITSKSPQREAPAQPAASGRAKQRQLERGSIGAVVAGFKSVVTAEINRLRATPGAWVWHRNYYERVIRNRQEYQRIARYITTHPPCAAAPTPASSPAQIR